MRLQSSITTQKRIAIHVFWDLILPIQRGEPGSKERRECCKEIEQVFRQSKYYPAVPFESLLDEDSYFITSDFRVEKDTVFFTGTDGKEYSAPKHFLVFEATHPAIFKIWDERKEQER